MADTVKQRKEDEMAETAYHVGQRVWIYSVNSRGREPVEATVTKVGRSLVTVDQSWWGADRPSTYRMENGRANNQYAHEWIQTEEQEVEAARRAPLVEYLRARRIHDLPSRLSTTALEQIVAILRADLDSRNG